MKHYKLTDEFVSINNKKFYRIKALIDLPIHRVKKGDLGGYVESLDNLSDNAWVAGNATVFGNAQVFGNAWVSDNAFVHGDARVYGDALVYANAMVSNNARVSGSAHIYGNAYIRGNSHIYGDARVYGDAIILGNARIKQNFDYVSHLLPSKFTITVTKQNVSVGCKLFTYEDIKNMTKYKAKELGLEIDYYNYYIFLIKTSIKFINKKRKQ